MAYFDFEPDERFRSAWSPAVDVYESGDEVIVRAELAGVARTDVQLSWNDAVLTISGVKHRPPSEQDGSRYLCLERQYGRFRRDVTLEVAVDFEQARAEFRDGLLLVRLPKLPDGRGNSLIPIH